MTSTTALPVTSIVGPTSVLESLLAERRALGQDGHDEVWGGVYHVAPYEHSRNTYLAAQLAALLHEQATGLRLRINGPFNLGSPRDFRVPDMGVHQDPVDWQLYMPTASIVVEVLSPEDETYAKFQFYAERDVTEIWVVDPEIQRINMYTLTNATYLPTEASAILGEGADLLESRLDWPA